MIQLHRVESNGWVIGTVGEYRFNALSYGERCMIPRWELADSTITKLYIEHNGHTVFNWDCGPHIEAANEEVQDVVVLLCESLGTMLPRRRGDRVRLLEKNDDNTVPIGAQGTVAAVYYRNGLVAVDVDWDDGPRLLLNVPPDKVAVQNKAQHRNLDLRGSGSIEQDKISTWTRAMPLSIDSCYGSLIGLLFADAAGAIFEGVEREQLRGKFENKAAALAHSLTRQQLQYTDDGQMALAVAGYLAENSTIISNDLMQRFVDVYESWRGYGRGARVLIEAFRDDAEYEFMAEHLFPGGSLGNGAAMRSAPVGLRFVGDIQRIWQEAKYSAWPTHRHELGIEGAQLVAVAASVAVTETSINPSVLAERLLPLCSTVVFQKRLERLHAVKADEDIEQFGNGIEAHESVVTALACFALYPRDYQQAIATAIWQGGDTDTICAMTGALVGAHIGSGFTDAIPLTQLEEGDAFAKGVYDLAEALTACGM